MTQSANEWKILKIRELIKAGNKANVYLRGDGEPHIVDEVVKVERYGVELRGFNRQIFLDPADIISVVGHVPINDPSLSSDVSAL